MNRKTLSLSASENVRVALSSGNAVLVTVTGTGWSGSLDFKSSLDGANWANHPYELYHSASPTAAVSQITSISTATTYIVKSPVTQCRIDVVVNGGSLALTYREVLAES
jgi:hypothetical protein